MVLDSSHAVKCSSAPGVSCCRTLLPRLYIPPPPPHSICTEKYSPPKASNLDVSFMHLTNYAVNKKNEAFVQVNAAKGKGQYRGKRSITGTRKEKGHGEEPMGLLPKWRRPWGCGPLLASNSWGPLARVLPPQRAVERLASRCNPRHVVYARPPVRCSTPLP